MTTPFTTSLAPFPGADPGVPQYWRTDTPGFWLGLPLSVGMIQLPDPNPDGYTATRTRGQTVHGLLDGGSAMTEYATSTGAWQLSWPRLAGRDWSVVDAFDRDLYGNAAGGYAWLPPEDVNRLTLRESMCGAVDGLVKGWIFTGGVPAYQAGVFGPVVPGGVMQWTPAASGAVLAQGQTGTAPGSIDTSHACPYVPGLPWCFSAWVWTASGSTTVQLRLSGRTTAGTGVTSVSSAALPVTTTPSLLWVPAVAGGLGSSVFVQPQFIAASTTPLLISNPQLESNAVPSDWRAGTGVPRVSVTSGLGRAPDVHYNSAVTLNLTEMTSGAA